MDLICLLDDLPVFAQAATTTLLPWTDGLEKEGVDGGLGFFSMQ